MNDLFQRSIEIILENQSITGAYPACPSFPTYRYSWYRDGSFIAYAMDLVGEVRSATRFHDWAAANILKRADVVERAIEKVNQGEELCSKNILHTRYTVEGEPASEEWPNFQMDGFGTWLWALGEHGRLNQMAISDDWLQASDLVADYLTALWDQPCYDCWEEFPDQIHPHTLAAIYGGLAAHERISESNHSHLLSDLRRFILEQSVSKNHFVKFNGHEGVDASLLGLAVPYAVVSPEDPLMVSTVAKIEYSLRSGGGVHRYETDSYYGGGEWILLTAWLGWYYAAAGERDKMKTTLDWVEAQALANGFLPEQIPASLNRPGYYDIWRERWGEIAKPLLWSHAKYLILSSVAMENVKK
jgi:GH15 family glucan-1,4-alpha-glucosidase